MISLSIMPKFDFFSIALNKLLFPFISWIGGILAVPLIVSLAVTLYAVFKYKPPLKLTAVNIRRLKRIPMRIQFFSFVRWKVIDSIYAKRNRDDFREFGMTAYCGRQGAGKTISMINYANWVRARYPECIIVSNLDYINADYRMEDWNDLVKIRNGKKGVLFLIDEIHIEFNSQKHKDFPEDLLAAVSQQRKQRIKICATSQMFMRMVKQLREQCFSVVQCSTTGGRWTRNKEYDAKDYELYCESQQRKKRLKPFRKYSFVQSDDLRRCYDTYELIEKLAKDGAIPRNERGVMP